VNAGVSLTHGQAGFIQALVYQTTADVPYSATIVVDGDLISNASGKNKASDVLSITERTLPFSGSIRLTGMSNAQVDNNNPSVPFSCASGDNNFISSPTYYTVPASSLTKQFKDSFKAKHAIIRHQSKVNVGKVETMTFPTALLLNAIDDPGPVIGPPNGTTYSIVSSSTAHEMSAACGFNDLGVPNSASYLVEIRHYENWNNGTLAGSWDETVKTFQSCDAGP
jgi:hypothetical protein